MPKRSRAEIEAIVSDVRDVCRRHGVALVGACMNEGIGGEILIVDLLDYEDLDLVAQCKTNDVHDFDAWAGIERPYYCHAIGDLEDCETAGKL